MLYIHRIFALFAFLFVFYVAATGTALQTVDMVTVLTNPPATDPNLMAVREHIDGPANYAIVTPADYNASALPASFNYHAALAKLVATAHAAAPGAGLRLVELRMINGKPAGLVQLDRQQLLFDAATGAPLPAAEIPTTPRGAESSLRNQVKNFHKVGFEFAGRYGTIVNAVAGVALSVLIFTGLWQYFKLLASRAALGRRNAFWFSGGWWRSLHRWFSVAASIFIIVLTGSGFLLSIDCIVQSINIDVGLAHHRNAHDVNRDVSSPMPDVLLPGMLQTTLVSYRAAMQDTPLRVVRLRYFSGIPQGVTVSDDSDATQLVFNAVTGQQMSETEPGYPDTGFMFGWQGHETLKKIHRGDFFGMTGRWLESIGALGILYLSISGVKMYYDLWTRRKKIGRHGLVWR